MRVCCLAGSLNSNVEHGDWGIGGGSVYRCRASPTRWGVGRYSPTRLEAKNAGES